MPRLPPLSALHAFEAAARHLSFRAAAAELGLTPTAISHRIRRLEADCGRPLFRRRPRPLALTPAGEALFPVLRDGFTRFAEAVAAIGGGGTGRAVRVTATNAFAARWLVPRLASWRHASPGIRLEILGTDNVLDLCGGEADVAIRYARQPPRGVEWLELMRDNFVVVGAPSLIGGLALPLAPGALARFPLIAYAWLPGDPLAPTWSHWQEAARAGRARPVPEMTARIALNFQEEPHAIDAVLAGQGIAICSDAIVGRELANGTLRQLSEVVLPGFGFYAAWRANHPKLPQVRAFLDWLRAEAHAMRPMAIKPVGGSSPPHPVPTSPRRHRAGPASGPACR